MYVKKSVQTWWSHRSVQKIWSGNSSPGHCSKTTQPVSLQELYTRERIGLLIELILEILNLTCLCWEFCQSHGETRSNTGLSYTCTQPDQRKRECYSLIPRPWYAQILSWRKLNFLHSCEIKFARDKTVQKTWQKMTQVYFPCWLDALMGSFVLAWSEVWQIRLWWGWREGPGFSNALWIQLVLIWFQ